MNAPAAHHGELHGVHVVEIGGTLASRLLVKLLTDQGAAVECLRLAGAGPDPAASSWDDGITARTVHSGTAAGKRELEDQVRRASVLIDASCGAMDAADLDFGRLTTLRPGLILCRIPPFPSSAGAATGEPRDEWAVAAALGLDHLTGQEPEIEPLPMASAYAAILSAIYITAALLCRDAGAEAMLMEVSLFGAGIMVLDRRLLSVADPACADPIGPWRLPIAERYECADGRYLQCQGAVPRVAAAVLTALGHPEWAPEALRGITALPSEEEEARWRTRLAAAFRQRTAAEWEELIGRHGGAGVVCRTQDEWKYEPHAAACEIIYPDEAGPGGRSRVGPAIRVEPAPELPRAALSGPAGSRASGKRDEAPDPSCGLDALPLAGTRVIDLSIILAGPTCGRLLAELGADVIKIDAPSRAEPPYVSPYGWLDVNRSKRSMLLDLGLPGGRDVLWRLIEGADVLLENFRAGKLEALGFGRAAIFARNPRIVYTSLNAYDFGGKLTDRAGWEQNAQAISGMQLSRGNRDHPRHVPVPVNDYGTGMLGAYGTLLALRAALRTGQGRRVLGSLARTASFLQIPGLCWSGPEAAGGAAVHLPGPVEFLRCADGWVAARRAGHPGGEGEWARRERAAVVEVLRRQGVPCTQVATVEELRSARWVRESGHLKTWQHPVWGEVTNVFAHGRSSGFTQREGWPAPDPGADGEQILESLGYSPGEIAGLLSTGALGAPVPLFRRGGR